MKIRCTKHGDWDTDWVMVNVCPHCYAEELVGPIKRCPVHHKDFTEASCPECVDESTSRLMQNWKERVETASAEEFDHNGKALRSGYGIVETGAEGTPVLLPAQWYCRMHGVYEPPVDGPSAYAGYGYHRVACPLCAAAGIQVQLDAEKKICEPLGGLRGILKHPSEFDPNGKKASDPGSKLDGGKSLAGVLGDFALALMAVAEVGTHGAEKYSRGGWQSVPDAETRYHDAEWRHLLKRRHEDFDKDSGLLHDAHRAWNVLAQLELRLRKDRFSEPMKGEMPAEFWHSLGDDWKTFTSSANWKDGAPGCPHTRTKFVKTTAGDYRQCLGCGARLEAA